MNRNIIAGLALVLAFGISTEVNAQDKKSETNTDKAVKAVEKAAVEVDRAVKKEAAKAEKAVVKAAKAVEKEAIKTARIVEKGVVKAAKDVEEAVQSDRSKKAEKAKKK